MGLTYKVFILAFALASLSTAHKLQNSIGDGECKTDSDCAPGACCSDYGFCGYGPQYCDNPAPSNKTTAAGPSKDTTTRVPPEPPGTCKKNSDCAANACCSVWGFCGVGPLYCNKNELSAMNETVEQGECQSNLDCPSNQPCCSAWGYCGSGPDYCHHEKPTEKPTTQKPLGACTSDTDCLNNACCSDYGYCGYGPQYCDRTPVPRNTTTPEPKKTTTAEAPISNCNDDADCPFNECCSDWGYCGYGPDYCGDRPSGTCKGDSDCSNSACCSKWGFCGYGPDYCHSDDASMSCKTNLDCFHSMCCGPDGTCIQNADICRQTTTTTTTNRGK